MKSGIHNEDTEDTEERRGTDVTAESGEDAERTRRGRGGRGVGRNPGLVAILSREPEVTLAASRRRPKDSRRPGGRLMCGRLTGGREAARRAAGHGGAVGPR
jgi:hypothetical protein